MTQTTGRGPERITESAPAGLESPSLRRIDRLRERLIRPGITELLIALFSGLIFSWRVATPSPW